MKEALISLFEYGEWTTERLLSAADALTQEQFAQKVLPSFGSAHLTLAHILGAEVLWFARSRGQSPKAMISPADVATVSAMRQHWAELIDQRRAYHGALEEDELAATVQWTNMRGQAFVLPRWQVMLHSVNHSTHHRSEVAAILTALGREPDSTDLLEFYLARAGQPWKPTGRA